MTANPDSHGLRGAQTSSSQPWSVDVDISASSESLRAWGTWEPEDEPLRLYQQGRETWPSAMRGDFAAVIADPEAGTVTATRDFPGVHPVYYRVDGSQIRFGSSVGAVAAPTAPRLSLSVLARNATGQIRGLGGTPFSDVRRVIPGSTVTWGSPALAEETTGWWTPPPRETAKWTVEALAGELRHRVVEAVARTTTPTTAVEVSGGLDSAALVGVMNLIHGPGLTGIAWVPADWTERDWPERAAVAELAKRHGVDVVPIALEREPKHPRAQPYPYGSAADARRSAYAKAASLGVTRLVSGWGGDQCASFSGGAHWSTSDGGAPSRSRARLALRTVRASLRDRADFDAVVTMLCPQARDSLFDYQPRFRGGCRADLTRTRQLTSGLIGRRLELDAFEASRFGIGYRYPLLDREVLRLCLSAPAALWADGASTRTVFRLAFADLIPPQIRERRTKFTRTPELARVRRDQLAAHCARVLDLERNERVRQFAPGFDGQALLKIPFFGSMMIATAEFIAGHAHLPWDE